MDHQFDYSPALVEVILLENRTNDLDTLDEFADVESAYDRFVLEYPTTAVLVRARRAGFTLPELAKAAGGTAEDIEDLLRFAYTKMASWLNRQS